MRVTDLTKQQSVLQSVNANAGRMQRLQENMASGRRISTLSDDPIGATQAQDFRTRLSFINMVKRNIQSNYVMLDRYDAELQHMSDLLQDAKILILGQANGNADDATRQIVSQELNAIIEGLVQVGNSKVGKLFIFAGTQTLRPPLELNEEIQPAILDTENAEAGIFSLDPEWLEGNFIGFSRNPYVVRIAKEGPFGRAHYVVSDDGGETWSKEKPLLRANPVVNEDGKPDDRVVLKFMGKPEEDPEFPIIFPKGLEFRFEPNPPVKYMGNDQIKSVPTGEGATTPINLTARQVLFAHQADSDSVNIFDLLFTIKRALVEDEPKVLQERITELDRAFNQVLNRRADMGAVRKDLELQFEKMSDREFTKIKQLSNIEDLDFQEAVVEMNLAEVRNQASLNAGSRLIQPSLLNFLR